MIRNKHTDKTILWGVELSPFTLKLQACLEHCGVAYKRLPYQGGYLENLSCMARLEYQKQRKLVTRYPTMDPSLDEYPAVPFFSQNGKIFQYDSSAIARYLDSKALDLPRQASSSSPASKLFPQDPVLSFVAELIDEAFDEFGLYMVHHMRWVGSAKSNIMGKLLAKEFSSALPPGARWQLAKSFPKRQVRRCPYLFSVAPKGYKAKMPKALSPPSREGFPETHSLLFECWKQYLKGMENILSEQAFLLGDTFTIADASAYGQLAMNLVDPEAKDLLKKLAPHTYNWLQGIYRKEHLGRSKANKIYLSKQLSPLLNTIMSSYSALMVQNLKAYQSAKAQGCTEFNEQAFDQGKALYQGKLRGYPFKTVIKTFQVRTWQELCQKWLALTPPQQHELSTYFELSELFSTGA